MPDYTCEFADPTLSKKMKDKLCTQKYICDDDPRITSSEIDWHSSNSLHNWQERLDLECKPDWLIGLLVTAFWVGFVGTMLWLPRVADLKGRKKIFAIGDTLSAGLYTIVLFSNNFYLTMFAIFGFGATNSIRTITGFIYFTEMMPRKTLNVTVSTFWTIDSCVYLCVIIYFWVISKYCFWLCLVGYVFSCTSAICSWFLPESPIWLLSLNRIEEAVNECAKIARVNGRKMEF